MLDRGDRTDHCSYAERSNCELPLRDSAGFSPDFAGFYTLQLLLQRHRPYHNLLIRTFPKLISRNALISSFRTMDSCMDFVRRLDFAFVEIVLEFAQSISARRAYPNHKPRSCLIKFLLANSSNKKFASFSLPRAFKCAQSK